MKGKHFIIGWSIGIGNYVQRNILAALSFYGTNARPAIPALISYIKNSDARETWEAISTLAMAGHNQPEAVFPVLFQTFSNATGNVRASNGVEGDA